MSVWVVIPTRFELTVSQTQVQAVAVRQTCPVRQSTEGKEDKKILDR
jgi:hypothetical protein